MQNDLDPKGLEAAVGCYSEGGCSGLDERERREVVTDIIEAYLSATVPAGDGELVERLTAEADYLDANLKTFTGPLSTITALRDAASRLSQGTGESARLKGLEGALVELADQADHCVLGIACKRNIEDAIQRLAECSSRARAALSGDTL